MKFLDNAKKLFKNAKKRGVTAAEILIAVVVMGIIALGTSAVVNGTSAASKAGTAAANAALATNFISQYAAAGQTSIGTVAIPATTDFTAAQLTSIFTALNAGVSYTMPGSTNVITLQLTPPEQNPGSYVGAYSNGQYVIAYSGSGNP